MPRSVWLVKKLNRLRFAPSKKPITTTTAAVVDAAIKIRTRYLLADMAEISSAAGQIFMAAPTANHAVELFSLRFTSAMTPSSATTTLNESTLEIETGPRTTKKKTQNQAALNRSAESAPRRPKFAIMAISRRSSAVMMLSHPA